MGNSVENMYLNKGISRGVPKNLRIEPTSSCNTYKKRIFLLIIIGLLRSRWNIGPPLMLAILLYFEQTLLPLTSLCAFKCAGVSLSDDSPVGSQKLSQPHVCLVSLQCGQSIALFILLSPPLSPAHAALIVSTAFHFGYSYYFFRAPWVL